MAEPLYRRLLGDAYAELPQPLQTMHDVDDTLTANGLATVERGTGPLARIFGSVFRFPSAGTDVPLTVTFRVQGGVEHWHRSFGGKVFYSSQEAGKGRLEGLLVERFGAFAFAMAAPIRDRRLYLEIRSARFLGVPLPSLMTPRIEVFEHDAEDRFNFHVDLALPVLGRLVRYTGWLVPEPGDQE